MKCSQFASGQFVLPEGNGNSDQRPFWVGLDNEIASRLINSLPHTSETHAYSSPRSLETIEQRLRDAASMVPHC
jgi:hypothetical protein